ncbi:GNAT family N-acetyltransferase [Pseudoalteromonas sp. XMcav1-K]|uniref:GNAT family N-acetyltransferase n=1 Tax=Pseudoalteromonas sp. XMcav1-K TaxID=3374372 RepID=UPI003757F5D4
MTKFYSKTFNELTTAELYAILKLRVDVFVVEQNCPYEELDGLDCEPQTQHIIGYDDNDVVAYARCLAPKINYENSAAIGRVLVKNEVRGKGLAHAIVSLAKDICISHWPEHGIEISAQCYLTEFYTELGFQVDGQEYLEDGIPHIHMKAVL